MERLTLGELVNLTALQTMADNLYSAAGIPVGILDLEGNILVSSGWQDICIRFHRINPTSLKSCRLSDQSVIDRLNDNDIVSYKCMNNMWEVSVPIIVEGQYLASIIVGQFFYDDEVVDIDVFIEQAHKFGFDENEYIKALKKVPVFSRERIKNMMNYYKGLVITLVESSMAKLKYIRVYSKYIRLFYSMQDLVFLLDNSKTFIECNNSYCAHRFIGRKYFEVVPSDVCMMFDHAIQKLDKSEIESFDYSYTINNKERWYSAQVSKIIHEMVGESDIYMVVCRDITQRKYIMDSIQKAKLEAEEANNAKSTFIANISHELKTPITVIQSATQLLELKLQNSSQAENLFNYVHFKTIKQNCRRLLRLVNNLIDATKVDAGFMNLCIQNLDIVDLVEKITVSVAEYAQDKNVMVEFNKNIDYKIIAADPDKIERILLNLLSNAIKFTNKNDKIIVTVCEMDMDIVISVRDTGIGIPEEKLNEIFNRFNQIGDIFSRNHEGSGIGLSLVKSFVEMHGGTICVKSDFGRGSEFIVKLPVKEPDGRQIKKNQDNIIVPEPFVDRLKVEFSDIYM